MYVHAEPQMEKQKILPQVVFLRALASLGVCVFHLTFAQPIFSDPSVLKQLFLYGWYGVQMFFIISGFIICYSLPEDYQLKDFKTFIVKRIVRIDPPYIICILLILFLLFISAPFNHVPFHFSFLNFLYHLGYLNNFKLGEYYSPVFWTLGIEFQFYILIGVIFWFIKKSALNLVIGIAFLLGISFIPTQNTMLVLYSLPLFCLGMAANFYLYDQKINTPTYLGVIAVCFVLIFIKSIPIFWCCVFTIMVIHFWKNDNMIIRFFSRISYSLYLTHSVIGVRVINLGLRFCHTTVTKHLLFVVALIVTIAFAWLFEIVVEKPFMRMAKSIHYKRPQSVNSTISAINNTI